MKLTNPQYFVLVDFDAAAGKRMAGRDLPVIRRLGENGCLKWISGAGKLSIWHITDAGRAALKETEARS